VPHRACTARGSDGNSREKASRLGGNSLYRRLWNPQERACGRYAAFVADFGEQRTEADGAVLARG
jgi:hypothetical protein